MGHLEDELMEIYKEIELKGLRKKFDIQITKMHAQSKHNWKSCNELWEYALSRVKGIDPTKFGKK